MEKLGITWNILDKYLKVKENAKKSNESVYQEESPLHFPIHNRSITTSDMCNVRVYCMR